MCVDGIDEVGNRASERQAVWVYGTGFPEIGETDWGQGLKLVLKRSWQNLVSWQKVIVEDGGADSK